MTATPSLPASPRLLGAGDLASWARFEALANDDAWSTTLLGSALSDDTLEVWGVFDAAELRAVAVVAYLPFDAELQSISVHPDARRRGLAAALLAWLLARTARGGAERMLLEVRASNQAAQRLYHKLGFAEDGRRRGYYRCDDGGSEEAVLMSRALPADVPAE
ncbi:GNAT family N-acetyltransferase [Salinicola sp. JS01]|uniref:GNAT family N-acetyltransferase n=1 Tax=Salinicola sp. JS01 TaxID=3050071 RepID=UPI00255BF86E|nr:GNAT family N-acetyltransferase [Salinicola sp. JS01]WIX32059.1 GNAT family N-acetyltransferase [Salinicola sp. JS01]